MPGGVLDGHFARSRFAYAPGDTRTRGRDAGAGFYKIRGARGTTLLRMTNRANGRFDIIMKPAEASTEGAEAKIGRMTMRKTWHGDLEGTSVGELLGLRSPVEGSAAYVAMERFEGTLAGRTGSFALVHRGMMNRGTQTMAIDVVPDSGAGDLTGLSGTLLITIEGGDHRYELSWEL